MVNHEEIDQVIFYSVAANFKAKKEGSADKPAAIFQETPMIRKNLKPCLKMVLETAVK